MKLAENVTICKFNNNALIRVFLHAEFISAMKTVQNPTVSMKNAKKKKKKKINK